MIFDKQILDIYRSMAYTRYDETGNVFYFSADDFDGLNKIPYEFCSSMGHALKGYAYYYDGYIPDRLVVFDHGIGGGHRSYMKEIEMLCRYGYKVFSYDHTGCMESGGETTNGMAQSLRDLNDCICFLKNEEDFKELEISVIGHSWGGFACLNITALQPHIAKVVVLSGFTSVERLINSFFGGVLKVYRKKVMKLEKSSNPEFADYDSVETLSKTSADVLLIYSDNDKVVRKMHYDTLRNALETKENIKFILEHNKDHNPDYTQDAVAYMAGFMSEMQKNVKKKLLETPEQKKKFISSFDWDRMTALDMNVWNSIIEFLNK